MLFSSSPITNYQFVTINVTSLSTRYYFPDLPNLRDAGIARINVYDYGYMRKDINNVVPFNYATQAMYLTLVRGNDEIYKRIPANELNPILFTTSQTLPSQTYNFLSFNGGIDFDLQKFNFSKCYIEFNDTIKPIVGESICFGIFYKK
jgi:hypothetical protein